MYGSNVVTTGSNMNVGQTGGAVATVQQQANVQNVFTQEQVNSIVAGRVNELNQKIVELTNLNAQLQASANQYSSELNNLRAESALMKEGVNPMMKDFVAFEVNKLAVNGKTFDTALKEFKAVNGHMFTNTNNTTQTGQGQAQGGVASNPVGVVGAQQAVQTVQSVAGVTGVAASNGAVMGVQQQNNVANAVNTQNASMSQSGQSGVVAGQVTTGQAQAVGTATNPVGTAVVGNTSVGGAVGNVMAGVDVQGFIKRKTKINI